MRFMRFKIFRFMLFVFFIQSCQNNLKTKKTYYFDGKIQCIEYFDKNDKLTKKNNYSREGNLVAELEYFNNELRKSKVFDENGKLETEFVVSQDRKCIQTLYHKDVTITGKGNLDKEGNQTGYWYYYDENNKVVDKIKF